jgi:hypothetical protein
VDEHNICVFTFDNRAALLPHTLLWIFRTKKLSDRQTQHKRNNIRQFFKISINIHCITSAEPVGPIGSVPSSKMTMGKQRISVVGLVVSVSIVISMNINHIHNLFHPEVELESAGLKSPLVEKVPNSNPAPCDADHFPCELSSVFPDPLSPEIAWDHKYSKDMAIPRGLGYYHIKPSDQFVPATHPDSRIWGQLGPSKSNIAPYIEGDAIPQNIRYYPGEDPSSSDVHLDIAVRSRSPALNREADDFIPASLGYYSSEVPLRLDDTDGFDPSSQSYMRDSSFYGDAYRAAYPFDPENRPKFYEAAAAA